MPKKVAVSPVLAISKVSAAKLPAVSLAKSKFTVRLVVPKTSKKLETKAPLSGVAAKLVRLLLVPFTRSKASGPVGVAVTTILSSPISSRDPLPDTSSVCHCR